MHPFNRTSSRADRRWWSAHARIIVSAFLALSAGCAEAEGGDLSRLVRELSRTETSRTTSGRISVAPRHAACVEPAAAATDEIVRCAIAVGAPDRDVSRVAARVSAALESPAGADAFHAAGLLELMWAGGGNAVDESIGLLSTASRLTRTAPVLADLSAAYLARAEQDQSAGDLLEAIEAAERALLVDGSSAPAWFNLALSLERLGLVRQAAQAWERYLSLDSDSEWAAEARARLERIGTAPAPIPDLTTDASVDAARALAASDRSRGRTYGLEAVLGGWGSAVLDGDTAEAARLLELAAAVGETVAAGGGDHSVADAVAAIRDASPDPEATANLARAHQAYAHGREVYDAARPIAAAEAFRRAAALRPASPALAAWIRFFTAAGDALSGDLERSRAAFEAMVRELDGERYPTLVAQAHSGIATILLRQGRFEEAIEAARTAARFYETAGERQRVGFMVYLIADAQFSVGLRAAGYRTAREALLEATPLGPSVLLHNLFGVMARAAAADGLVHAAVRLQNEGVHVAEALGNDLYSAEAVLTRARLRASAGDHAGAREDLARGSGIVAAAAPGWARTWLEVDRRLTLSRLHSADRPALVAAAMDTVLGAPAEIGTPMRMIQAYVARADGRFGLGNVPGAIADLDSATALLDEQRAAIGPAPLRIALADHGRSVVDRLVMLAAGSGDAAAALGFLERGRASFSASAGGVGDPLRPPPDRTAVEYALIGDTLLAIVARNDSVRLFRSTVDREALQRTIETARAHLEIGASSAESTEPLTALHDQLVLPIRRAFGPPGEPIVIVADGEIAGAPFAALRDRSTGRYLVEDHPLSFVGSLRDVSDAAVRQPPRRVLLVADSARGRPSPGLPDLPGAVREVAGIARIYPEARRLDGTTTARDTLLARLRDADVFHFAGHAVVNDRAPEESYLVLGPDPLGTPADRMTAADLEALGLGNLDLVVLSACETLRAHDGRAGGFAGFSGALLRAGVRGVVGSTWRVEDEVTAALMTRFHQHYARTGDGAQALRAAQLLLLGSGDPTLQHPAAWAGFRYAGS